jgi:hypothetical protein
VTCGGLATGVGRVIDLEFCVVRFGQSLRLAVTTTAPPPATEGVTVIDGVLVTVPLPLHPAGIDHV